MRKVISHSARAAILLVTIGMTEVAWAGPRIYDLNILLVQPHPWAPMVPSAVSPSTPAPVERIREPPPVAAPSPSRQVHNYTFNLRLVPWLTQPDGEIRVGSGGPNIDVQDDLGFDDYEFAPSGSANLRFGRHDFWFDALVLDISASDTINRTIDFGSITIPIGRPVKSGFELELYDLRYGYSFFELEPDGFRLGPTVGIGYLEFDATVTDQVSGASESISEAFPIPRIGVQGSIPYGNYLFEGKLSGLYIDYEDIEGYAVEGDISVAWRPYRNFGLVGGYRVLAVDVDVNDDNYDLVFQGPYIGVEFRY